MHAFDHGLLYERRKHADKANELSVLYYLTGNCTHWDVEKQA